MTELGPAAFGFPRNDHKVFDENYLESAVVELRYPTLLRLDDSPPVGISEELRSKFPHYNPNTRFQMTAKGTTGEQPVYQFATRSQDMILEITSSTISLQVRKYKSFDDLMKYLEFVLNKCVPLLDTNFFTRIGLRFINKVAGVALNGSDIAEWINLDLTKPIGVNGIGTITHMHSQVSGSCGPYGSYLFQYGLSPEASSSSRIFILDWDYYREDVEVDACVNQLKYFHEQHRDFFWWALGKNAQEALKNGTARRK